MRIALALESSGPGGAEQMLLRLAEALRERRDEPRIVTLRPGWMTERAEQAGLPVEIVPQARGLDPLWVPRFAALLRRRRIDVLHAHEFAMSVYGGTAARLARIGSLATIHGHHWVAKERRRALALRALVRLGQPLVAVSDELADFLAESLPLERARIHVVPNGIPVAPRPGPAARSEARRALPVPLDAPLALAVGNLYPVKDHATLLRAAARLPALHVAIAGRGGEEQRLRGLAAELGIADRVHLLGLRDDVDRLLAAADVFVQPSRREGLPLAVLEAMAAGRAVVATDVGGIGEAITPEETGLLLPPGDAAALAAALSRVLEDADLRARLEDAAYARAREQFSVARMTDRYAELYVSTSR